MGLFGSSVDVFADSAVNAELHEVVKQATEELVIVSPYIDLGRNLVNEIIEAARRARVEFIIRRDKESEYRKTDWFAALVKANVSVRSVERLHAKVYLNEKEVVVGSANFSEDSWSNSRELCVGFDRYGKEGEKIAEYVEKLRASSEPVSLVRSKEKKVSTGEGYCIGCRDSVPRDFKRPSCRKCFAEVKTSGGKHCHECGGAAQSSIEKPRCYACFKSSP